MPHAGRWIFCAISAEQGQGQPRTFGPGVRGEQTGRGRSAPSKAYFSVALMISMACVAHSSPPIWS